MYINTHLYGIRNNSYVILITYNNNRSSPTAKWSLRFRGSGWRCTRRWNSLPTNTHKHADTYTHTILDEDTDFIRKITLANIQFACAFGVVRKTVYTISYSDGGAAGRPGVMYTGVRLPWLR